MDKFDKIIQKLIEQLNKNSIVQIKTDDSFRKATDEERLTLDNLFDVFIRNSTVYNEDELEIIKKYYIPHEILDFYKNHMPHRQHCFDGDVSIFNLDNIIRENSELVPGALLIKYGILAFAKTSGGNVICIDLNEAIDNSTRVLIADHSIFYDKNITIYKNGERKRYELSYDLIKNYAPQISSSFTEFLEKLANQEIEDVEEYL